jgi:hypothetical protein
MCVSMGGGARPQPAPVIPPPPPPPPPPPAPVQMTKEVMPSASSRASQRQDYRRRGRGALVISNQQEDMGGVNVPS